MCDINIININPYVKAFGRRRQSIDKKLRGVNCSRCSVSENLGEFRFFLGLFRGVPDFESTHARLKGASKLRISLIFYLLSHL